VSTRAPGAVPGGRSCPVRLAGQWNRKAGSDYDLLVILPDGTEQNVRSAIMGSLHDLAQQLGVKLDREYISLSTWQNPGSADPDLVGQAKTFGIEIPDHAAGTRPGRRPAG
jgi:hypothetical protein